MRYEEVLLRILTEYVYSLRYRPPLPFLCGSVASKESRERRDNWA